jgi:uncharacterized membrane protein
MVMGKKRVLIVATLVAVGVMAIGGVAAAGTMLEASSLRPACNTLLPGGGAAVHD